MDNLFCGDIENEQCIYARVYNSYVLTKYILTELNG